MPNSTTQQVARAFGLKNPRHAERIAGLISRPQRSRAFAKEALWVIDELVDGRGVKPLNEPPLGEVWYVDRGDASEPTVVWSADTGKFELTDLGSYFDGRVAAFKPPLPPPEAADIPLEDLPLFRRRWLQRMRNELGLPPFMGKDAGVGVDTKWERMLLKQHLRRNGLPEQVMTPNGPRFDGAIIGLNPKPGEGSFRITYIGGPRNLQHEHYDRIEEAIMDWRRLVRESKQMERRVASQSNPVGAALNWVNEALFETDGIWIARDDSDDGEYWFVVRSSDDPYPRLDPAIAFPKILEAFPSARIMNRPAVIAVPYEEVDLMHNDKIAAVRTAMESRIKTAGATTFRNYGEGPDPRKVFDELVAQARWEEGHGGYSGTIAEKDNFKIVQRTPVSREEANRIADRMEDNFDKYDPAGAIPVTVPKASDKKIVPFSMTVWAKDQKDALEQARAAMEKKYSSKVYFQGIDPIYGLEAAKPSIEVVKGLSLQVKERSKSGQKPQITYYVHFEGNYYGPMSPQHPTYKDAVDWAKRVIASIAEQGKRIPNKFDILTQATVLRVGEWDVIKKSDKGARFKITGDAVVIKEQATGKIDGWLFFGWARD